MFYGEFEHSIDEKGRITVPAKFRSRLEAGLVVTKGIDRCLILYPADVWASLAARIAALPITNPHARDFQRQMFGGAADALPDKLGRIGLPTYLRQYANIDKQVVIVGLHDHCEIWDPEQLQQRRQRSEDDPEWRAEQFASLGI